MLRQTIGALGFAVVVFASALAQAAFPEPTGTCTGSVCTFENDLIETRAFGFGQQSLVLSIDNLNANSAFGEGTPGGVSSVLPRVGSGFQLNLTTRTTERIYVSNDSAVIDQGAYDTARAKFDTNTAQIGNLENQISQNEAEVAAKRAEIRAGVTPAERRQLRSEIRALNRESRQAGRQINQLNVANANQIRKAKDAMVFGGTLIALDSEGNTVDLQGRRVSIEFPNDAVNSTNEYVAFTYETRLVDKNGNVYTGFGVVSQTNRYNNTGV